MPINDSRLRISLLQEQIASNLGASVQKATVTERGRIDFNYERPA